jgi:hypothetical protein
MSEMEPTIEDEDKAQSTLGSQSALMSMLNMGITYLSIQIILLER